MVYYTWTAANVKLSFQEQTKIRTYMHYIEAFKKQIVPQFRLYDLIKPAIY